MSQAGEADRPWTGEEIARVIEAYLDLRSAEARGERPVKASLVRELRRLMPVRTAGSIEFKMGNISAVLDELHEPWVEGYKPYPNYQRALKVALLARLDRDHGLTEAMAQYQANAIPAPFRERPATDDLLVPPPSANQRTRQRSIGLTVGPSGAIRDLQNRALGKAGEQFILNAERVWLERQGRADLARAVEWTSEVEGDGAGYDISSFRVDGTPRHIEVKTTNLGVRTPFHITRWEVATSKREPTIWSLYRVFDFRSAPRLYRLDGSVDESSLLEPSVFVGLPR